MCKFESKERGRRGTMWQFESKEACANLGSLAVPLGGCAKAGVSFFLARCARGGCKESETELAVIYVRSLCRWAVARTLV